MKRPARTYRVAPGTQHAIEALSAAIQIPLGEVIELAVEDFAVFVMGADWRGRVGVQESGQLQESGPQDGTPTAERVVELV